MQENSVRRLHLLSLTATLVVEIGLAGTQYS